MFESTRGTTLFYQKRNSFEPHYNDHGDYIYQHGFLESREDMVDTTFQIVRTEWVALNN